MPAPSARHLSFERHYDSGSLDSRELGLGNGCQYPFEFLCYYYRKEYYGELDQQQNVKIPFSIHKGGRNPSGASLRPELFDYGYVDCLRSPLGGCDSIRNIRINFHNNDEHMRNGYCLITKGDGSVSDYRYKEALPFEQIFHRDLAAGFNVAEHCYRHLLTSITQQDKQLTLFTYKAHGKPDLGRGSRYKDYRIDTICSYDSEQKNLFDSFSFAYHNNSVTLTRENDREVIYYLQKKEGCMLLDSVTAKHLPDTSFETSHNKNWQVPYKCTRVIRPDNRVLQVEYEDDSEGRVSCLKIPNAAGKLETLYSFHYDKDCTEVKGLQHSQERFFFSNDHYLTEHQTLYQGRPYKSERFFWSKGAQKGLLLAKAKLNQEGVLQATHYVYDDRANIIQKTHFGNRDGSTFTINDEGQPIGSVNAVTVDYEYSQDGLNNLIRQVKSNGQEEYVSYQGVLPLCKLSLINGAVYQREFFRYDDKGLMSEWIEDDGASEDPDNLFQATYQKVTCTSYDGALPVEVTEYYHDFTNHSLRLFNRTLFHYDVHGNLITKELFSSKGLETKQRYCYDDKDLLSQRLPPNQRLWSELVTNCKQSLQ